MIKLKSLFRRGQNTKCKDLPKLQSTSDTDLREYSCDLSKTIPHKPQCSESIQTQSEHNHNANNNILRNQVFKDSYEYFPSESEEVAQEVSDNNFLKNKGEVKKKC